MGGLDPPTARERGVVKFLLIVDPIHISRMAEDTDLKFCVLIDCWGP